MVRFVLLGVEKFRKGTNVVSFGTFETITQAEARKSEIGFVRRRADPFIVPEPEVAAFIKARRTGIFLPTFDPIKAAAEEAAKIRRAKEQESFERKRTLAKTGTLEQQRVAILSLQSKFGIMAKVPTPTKAQFVEARILRQLRTGTTLTEFRTFKETERIKAQARIERARETRKEQLRKAGAEVIFKPSEKFFGVVPTGEGIKKISPIPTETELVRELKAQKGFVTFVSPKKPEKKVEISIFKPIVIPAKLKPPEPKKIAVTRLERFEQRIELFKEREQRRAERFERAEEFISNVFPRLKGKGFVRETVRKVPVVPFAFIDFVGSVAEKIEITGKGLFIPEARPFVLKESKRAFVSIPKESVTIVKELFTTPEGVASLPFIFLLGKLKLPKVTKGAKARAVLRQIAREKPPTIRGEPIIRFDPISIDVKTIKVLRKPGLEIKKPGELVTTKIRAIQPEVIGAVTRSVGGPTQISSVTIGGKQFTTASRTFKGKEFSIRSETNIATGKTTTKVFRVNARTGDLQLLKTIKSTEKPIITFTEPIQRVSRKSFLDEPGSITEFLREVKTTKGVSLVRKGFVPTGRGVILSEEFLRARVIRPRVKARAEIEIDLITGKTKLIPKSIEVVKERIKFVDFPPKQKPQILEITPEGLVITRPSTILTTQIARFRAPFEITFAKRVKPKIPKEVKPTKAKEISKEILEGFERLKKERAKITKKEVEAFFLKPREFPKEIKIKPTKPTTLKDVTRRLEELRKERDVANTKRITESFKQRAKQTKGRGAKTTQKQKGIVREVQRPTPLQLKKFKQKFFLPEAETVFLRGAKTIGIPLSIQKSVQRQIQQLTPKQIQQLRVVQEQRIVQEQRVIQQQRLLQKQRVIQKERVIPKERLTEVQKVLQQQRLTQEQRVIQQQKLIETLKVPTEKIPTTRFPPPRIVATGGPGGFFIFFPDFPKGTGITKPAFTTEVREGERKADKFIRVRKRVLPRQRAINLGARIADNTTARTFRIKRRGTTKLSDTGRFPLKDKFRGRIGKSKLPPKVFVEKSKFAIDSPGERLGIPFNPLRIPRLKEAQARKRQRKQRRRFL